jgi:DNA-binding MarR family transcriptional regulator
VSFFAQLAGLILYGYSVSKSKKYVNMADVISKPAQSDAEIVELVELLFFAYRDFVSDPDAILSEFGFGRAHHRVMHFVGRNPGMTVAQLLNILRITKQSLGRVLRELIDKGYVRQQEGEADRRQRLVFLTEEGARLHRRLMQPQLDRIRRALGEAGPQAQAPYRAVLFHLISPENRDVARDWIAAQTVIGDI